MTTVVVELVRSADWAAGVVLVNGHGGNHRAITDAVATLTKEGRHALAWWPKWPQRNDGGPNDLHAGRIETSLMLAIDPGLVRFELAEAGPDTTIDELRARGVRAVSPSGVLGDPERRVRGRRRPVHRDVRRRPRPRDREMATDRPDAAPLTGPDVDQARARTRRDGRVGGARRFVIDGSWQRFDRVVIAGSPLRIFRVTERGADTLAAIERGDPVDP